MTSSLAKNARACARTHPRRCHSFPDLMTAYGHTALASDNYNSLACMDGHTVNDNGSMTAPAGVLSEGKRADRATHRRAWRL